MQKVSRDGKVHRSNTGSYEYHRRKRRAILRGKIFNLSLAQYIEITTQLCVYCGTKNNIGLERIDNKLGYFMRNMLSVCRPCNVARNEHFTVDEMRRIIGPAIKKVWRERAKKT